MFWKPFDRVTFTAYQSVLMMYTGSGHNWFKLPMKSIIFHAQFYLTAVCIEFMNVWLVADGLF